MIDINELKPILSDILGEREDTASIIERITAIDKPSDTPPADYEARITELNSQWEKRFKDTFFKPQATNEQAKSFNEPAGGEPEATKEPTLTYDGLFKKGE